MTGHSESTRLEDALNAAVAAAGAQHARIFDSSEGFVTPLTASELAAATQMLRDALAASSAASARLAPAGSLNPSLDELRKSAIAPNQQLKQTLGEIQKSIAAPSQQIRRTLGETMEAITKPRGVATGARGTSSDASISYVVRRSAFDDQK